MPTNRRGRSRPIIAIGTAISLAGLSYYLYQRFTSGSAPLSDDDNASRGEGSESARKKYVPTLSLSLPSTFVRTTANMILLEDLLSILSQHYLVTLIAPPPPHHSATSPHTSPSPGDHQPSSASSSSPSAGTGIESVASLSHSLSSITNFDSRRVLEYSKEEGKLALARALACDAHCEVMIEAKRSSKEDYNNSNENESDSLFADDEQDGELTPRATSPSPSPNDNHNHKLKDINSQEYKISLLEKYHADMARIRKSSGLLIFLLLPVNLAQSHLPTTSQMTVSELDLETVIQPFLLPGQKELSSRVPGVKIVDERTAEKDIAKAWSQAGRRVGSLSKGWQ